jgi:Domain of unknown function (DUF4352)
MIAAPMGPNANGKTRTAVVGLALVAVLFAALVISGCGVGDERDVKEGEALDLGDLTYDVQITRFLNPGDPEDKAYLQNVPPASPGQRYLAVFMTIDNTGDTAANVPTGFKVTDTRENRYEPTTVSNDFALKLGERIPPDSGLPAADTPAADGPIGGSMLLFAVDDGVTENRPIELTIPSPSGSGQVELDI